jgi:hypothetical protein
LNAEDLEDTEFVQKWQEVCADGSHKPQPAVAATNPPQQAQPGATAAVARAGARVRRIAYSASIWPPAHHDQSGSLFKDKIRHPDVPRRMEWPDQQLLGRVCSWH